MVFDFVFFVELFFVYVGWVGSFLGDVYVL